jgi:hypothetical protein
MKYNKWTLGLAAVGAVSLASVAQAEEKMLLGSQADLTATTISGYVNTSIHMDFGQNSELANTRGYAYSAGKGDGFNLDVVDINIEKPLDESEWAAGYRAEMWFGPDALGLGSRWSGSGDVAIKQAYVALRTPVGNGIDWKVGVFDTIIGYEASNAGDNPNYSRSWGYSMEPTQHTGLLGTYRLNESFSFSGGIANTWNAPVNGRDSGNTDAASTYMASVAYTAPESTGFLSGGGIYAGIVRGKQSGVANTDQAVRISYYAGMTIPTPVENLKAGLAFDYLTLDGGAAYNTSPTTAIAGYLSFGMSEKLTLHGRMDYVSVGGDGITTPTVANPNPDVYSNGTLFQAGDDFISTTATADYQLWENVISRMELRWDHDLDNADHFRSGTADDEFTLLANVIYKF